MSRARLAIVFLLLSVSAFARQSELQTELQRIVAPPPPNGDPYYNFDVGGAVAISDEWAAVADKTVNDATGEVYLYRRTSCGWFFQQRLIGEEDSAFGGSLAIDGDTLAVGGWLWGGQLGKVYIFQFTGAAWVKTQEILPDGLEGFERPKFGNSVALSGDVLVVGAPWVDAPVEDGGEVRVYERVVGTWQPAARFRLPPVPEVLAGDLYGLGYSVAVSGNTIVAGAPLQVGAVYTYERGPNGWLPAAVIENPSPELGDTFGYSVGISGEHLVIGMPATVGSHYRPGKAYILERTGSGTWNLEQEIRASDGYADGDHGDDFGAAVAVDGDHVIVGALNGRMNGPDTGTLYLFTRTPSGWPATENLRLIASDSSGQSDRLGAAVDMEGPFVVGGAIGGWCEGIREGKAYAFALELGESYCEPTD